MLPQILENTFNYLLASDYQGKKRLNLHLGKSVGFNILPMHLQLVATITNEGLSVNSGSVDQADCSISGTPIALIRYMNTTQINPSTNHMLGIEVDGDLEFAREISTTFRSLDVDWDEIFSQVIGDAPARQLGKFMTNLRGDFQRSKGSAKAHLNYIITERMDQIVSMQEAEQFYRDVDQIAVDTLKLEQKINLLVESPNHG